MCAQDQLQRDEDSSSNPAAGPNEGDRWDLAALSSRITSIQEAQSLQERLESLPHAWVLVFDADTDDEAVG